MDAKIGRVTFFQLMTLGQCRPIALKILNVVMTFKEKDPSHQVVKLGRCTIDNLYPYKVMILMHLK